MSYSDSIADMLTRIRNGQQAGKKSVSVRLSKMSENIAKVLQDEGYIASYSLVGIDGKVSERSLSIELKYVSGKIPVITKIDRVSRPGLRVYSPTNSLPKVMSGLGIAVISTSKGVLSDSVARQLGVGGEVLCLVA
jgi:small subunit ribosomal protein S8